MKKPVISILIPTYQRPELLSVCLESIFVQKSIEKIEVIVIDNDKLKSAKDSVMHCTSVSLSPIYLVEPRLGHSFAKNNGLKNASGEYCIFLDDDAILPPGWVSNAIQILKTKNPDVIGGPIKPYFKHQPPEWYKATYESRNVGSKGRALRANEFLPTSSTLIRTKLLREIGGFNAKYGIKGSMRRFGEDTDVLRRVREENLKTSLLYAPELEILHFTPPQKTRLAYIFSHHFNLGASGQAVSGDKIPPIRIIVKAVMSALGILGGIARALLFRDTRRYHHVQNYLWEIVAPRCYWFGRFYQLIRVEK